MKDSLSGGVFKGSYYQKRVKTQAHPPRFLAESRANRPDWQLYKKINSYL